MKRLFERGDRSRIHPQHVEKVELILADIAAADSLEHLRRPGYRLHSLQGRLKDHYAIDVSGNWRVIFRFEGGNAANLDLVDYH